MYPVEIVNYEKKYAAYFETLNRAWIEKYFWMEPIDFQVLQKPEENILQQGGKILFAKLNNEIIGTVALKRVNNFTFEFTKMAVDEKHQGKKVGWQLTKAALTLAKEEGATNVVLYSNTKLVSAIELYRKIGFVEVPLDGPYKRSDIKMKIVL
jgi:ribosomal protein S18 acetylase RimI-like enzyme